MAPTEAELAKKAAKAAKKEREEKEAKGDKKEKKKDKESKDKESKEKDPEKKKDKKEKRDKDAAPDKESSSGRAPPARGPPGRGGPKAPSGGYLDGMDLPSSEEEEEEKEVVEREDKRPLQLRASDKESKKIADKERKAMEKAYQAKEEAMREDENVFDVAFEGMGSDLVAATSTDVKVTNLTIRAKGKMLLDGAQLTIAAGRRYGLIGPNGHGKSTLLRMLAKRQIPVPENIDVLLVEQEVVGDDKTALQSVVAADVELQELRAEEEELNRKLGEMSISAAEPGGEGEEAGAAGSSHDAMAARLSEVYDRLQEIGASSAESRASKILHGLGFTEAMQRRATRLFSGGWRMRISLARALYIQPTLLLLDEPTNHLDLRAVLWLEEYLQRWKKTLVVVSHDRDFLNTITTDIIHLHDLKLQAYRGNFAQFDEMYDQRRREANKAYDKFEKQLKAARSKGGVDAKAKADKVRNFAAKAEARKARDAGEEAAGPSAAPQKWSDYQVEFHFPESSELNPPLIQMMDVDFKYPGREDFGLQGVNFGVDMGDRIAIVGPNGAGKTTFMNLLCGDLQPTGGTSRRPLKLRIGRYAQHFVDALEFDVNPVEYLMNKFPESGLKPEQMRAKLGRFGLKGQHHLTPICKLSGGQKARVVFTAISLLEPHILLLDEPTNHLDMQSIDALCDALEEFKGGVVVISHDATLLERLCEDEERSQVLVVEDGTIRRHPGDFQDYRNSLIKEITTELDEDEKEWERAAARKRAPAAGSGAAKQPAAGAAAAPASSKKDDVLPPLKLGGKKDDVLPPLKLNKS